MDVNEYQAAALRTAKRDQPFAERMEYGALALAGETGEFCELVKKATWHGHSISPFDALKELGDLSWYVAFCADVLGLTLSELETLAVPMSVPNFPTFRDRAVKGALSLPYTVGKFVEATVINPDGVDEDDRNVYLGLTWRLVQVNAAVWGYAMEDVLTANIAKLKARYPEGFTTAASVARVDVA